MSQPPAPSPVPTGAGAPATAPATRPPLVALVVDLAAVLIFAGVGRANHAEDSGLAGAAGTALPFWLGVLVAWVLVRGWRAPTAPVPTGLVVWVGTVVVGLGLRVLGGDGAPVSFVVVTALVLGVLLLGWRVVTTLATRAALRRASRG